MKVQFIRPQKPEYLDFEAAMSVVLGEKIVTEEVVAFEASATVDLDSNAVKDSGIFLLVKYIARKHDLTGYELETSFERSLRFLLTAPLKTEFESCEQPTTFGALQTWQVRNAKDMVRRKDLENLLKCVVSKCRELPDHLIRIKV